MKRAKLIIVEGEDRGREFKLDKSRIRIGRSKLNEIILDESDISQFHAQIVAKRGKFIIANLGSHLGVEVNGEKVGERVLSAGDRVKIGTFQFEFQRDEAAPSEAREGFRPLHLLTIILIALLILLLAYALYWSRKLLAG